MLFPVYITVKVSKRSKDLVQHKNVKKFSQLVNFTTEIVQITQKTRNLKQLKTNTPFMSFQLVKQMLVTHFTSKKIR